MANTTVAGAVAIHGQNPQFLVDAIIRNRIYESTYWKEHCFALTAETLIDKAIEVKFVGGTFGGNGQPTAFICLLLKLLQIQPEKEILVEYLQADEFKYLRALSALYIRMAFRAVEVYELLEPLLTDYRKLRHRSMAGYSLTYMDEFVYSLLNDVTVCDISLPRIAKRQTLEDNRELGPRQSPLLDALEGDETNSRTDRSRSRSGSRSSRSSSSSSRESGSRSRIPSDQWRSRSGSRGCSDHGSRHTSRSRSRSRSASSERYKSRSRSISPDRMAAESTS